jgi:hypothetical protein
MLKNGNIIIPDHNQAFQEYPKRIELWQSENKLLRMVARWNTKSIVHYKYADSQAWELRRDYINPYHPATESELMLNQLRMFSKNKLPV